MEHIQSKYSSESRLQVYYVCPVDIFDILKVIEKNEKIEKCSTLPSFVHEVNSQGGENF